MPIVPEASEDGSVARARLREATTKFSAQHALCFREEERQRLLAIMESAYGAFEPFNLLVRQVVTGLLNGALEEHEGGADSAWSAVRQPSKSMTTRTSPETRQIGLQVV